MVVGRDILGMSIDHRPQLEKYAVAKVTGIVSSYYAEVRNQISGYTSVNCRLLSGYRRETHAYNIAVYSRSRQLLHLHITHWNTVVSMTASIGRSS